ncbi:MAG: PAS domain S-box protein [Chitinivibrionales bacterium]|nr:PAS domain S-box protein [Chitinivibrionales bacterium]
MFLIKIPFQKKVPTPKSPPERSIQFRLLRTFLPAVMVIMVATGTLFVSLRLFNSSGFNPVILMVALSIFVLAVTAVIIIGIARMVGGDIEASQEALRKSEQKFRSYIENAPDGIFVVDNAGRFVEANKASCLLTGYSEDELKKMSIRDLQAEQSWEAGSEHFKKVNKTGSADADMWHKHKNGALICLNVKAVKLSDTRSIGFSKDVTERISLENSLRTSEKRYRELVDNAGQAILIAQDGAIKFANPMLSRLTGYSNSELRAVSYLEFIHPDDRNLIKERHAARIAGKTPPPVYAFRLVTKNSETIWVEISAVAIEWEGRPATLSFLNDITDRWQAEEVIIKNAARLRSLTTILQRPFRDSRELLDFALDEAIKLTESKIGYIYYYSEEREEFTLNTWSKGVMRECTIEHPPTIYQLDKTGIWGEAVRQRGPIIINDFQADHPLKKGYPAGHAPLYKFMTVPVFVNGKIVAVTGVANKAADYDETDVLQLTLLLNGVWKVVQRQVAEADLAGEKERLAVTLRSIGDGVITTDTKGAVVIMNRIAEELTGWSQDEARGLPLGKILTMIDQRSREALQTPVEKILASGEIVELANHTVLVSRNGKERIIADSGAPIKGQDGAVAGVVMVFRDITEKQKLLDQMQKAEKLDSLGILAGGIAHDFNNLLSGIFGYIDMARERSTGDPVTSIFLDKAVTVFERAKNLTRQLLTFSKGGTPVRKTGQLGALVKESATFALSGAKIFCEFKIAPDLWACDFDENQMAQVIDNIVINALQTMPHGGRLVITAENTFVADNAKTPLRNGKYLKISIADTGVGIQPDLLKRIFDPFFTTKHTGSGLGLATSYSIIQKHDGCIEVESEPGKGSVFHIYLPASQKEPEADVNTPVMSHSGSGLILVMDDEDFVREIIGNMLKKMGYSVVEAKDGREALAICSCAMSAGASLNAAIFDLTIPGGMGGREAMTEMARTYPTIPVFASSGYSEDPVMSNPRGFGFVDSIRKPYRDADLASMLNRHIAKQEKILAAAAE